MTEDGKGDAAGQAQFILAAKGHVTDRMGREAATNVLTLLAEVERLTGERDEAVEKRLEAARIIGRAHGRAAIYESKLHKAEAEIGRLSGLVAATKDRLESALHCLAEGELKRSRPDTAGSHLRAALAALREDGEAG